MRPRASQRGGAMVELSLCIVPFIMFLWGTLAFSHAVFAYNNVAFLAREATRWAAVHGASSGNVADEAAVATYTKRRSAGLDKSKLNVTAAWSNAAKTAGSQVTVTVTYAGATLPLKVLARPLTVGSSSSATILH